MKDGSRTPAASLGYGILALIVFVLVLNEFVEVVRFPLNDHALNLDCWITR